MAKITTLPGLGKSSQELLEVAGFLDVEALAKAGVDDLVGALEKANDILKISNKTPTRCTVQKWVESAREITGTDVEEAQEERRQMPVNYEGNPEVATMLAAAPCAIPLPGKVMMENRLAVADVPPAILLNRYSGDLEVRVNDRDESPVRRDTSAPASKGSSETPTRPIASGNVQRAEQESRLDIDTSRVKTFEEFSEMPKQRMKPSGRPTVDNDRIALLRAPREETNRGRDPKSRWYIRGVLHTHPFGMALGAVVTLLLIAVVPAAIISAVLLFVSDQFPGSIPWDVPKWLLAFPLALPVCGLLYLFYGLGGKCRICGQRQFWPRHCRKNSKAHYVPGLGYIVPVSFHMLIFKWFRCTYCGTPVRLKK